MRSCVILIPVMAVKAGARTFDSYSCVVSVSETTLMSMPAKGLAASTNHCISFSWSARDSAERSPISESRNFLAASMSANAEPVNASSRTAVVVRSCFRILLLPWGLRLQCQGPLVSPRGLHSGCRDEAENADGVDHGQGASPPQAGADEAQPCELN